VQTPPDSRNEADLQAFKDELKELQKKVDEQSAELQRLKNPSPKKK
jgi:tetrahydromethanopterin S-methyltransferase subunit G